MKDQVLLKTLKAITSMQTKYIVSKSSKEAVAAGKWWYIGCDLDMFYDTLTKLGEQLGCIPNTVDFFNIEPSKKFLDVGCGTGITLHIAAALGFDAYGIENDPATLELLQSTHGITDRIIVRDALTYTDYHNYDVIFCYRPFSNEDLQRQLETKIMASMKQHAILVPQHLLSVKKPWIKP